MKHFKTRTLCKCLKSLQSKFKKELSPLEHLQLEKISIVLKKAHRLKKKKSPWRFIKVKQWLGTTLAIIKRMV